MSSSKSIMHISNSQEMKCTYRIQTGSPIIGVARCWETKGKNWIILPNISMRHQLSVNYLGQYWGVLCKCDKWISRVCIIQLLFWIAQLFSFFCGTNALDTEACRNEVNMIFWSTMGFTLCGRTAKIFQWKELNKSMALASLLKHIPQRHTALAISRLLQVCFSVLNVVSRFS